MSKDLAQSELLDTTKGYETLNPYRVRYADADGKTTENLKIGSLVAWSATVKNGIEVLTATNVGMLAGILLYPKVGQYGTRNLVSGQEPIAIYEDGLNATVLGQGQVALETVDALKKGIFRTLYFQASTEYSTISSTKAAGDIAMKCHIVGDAQANKTAQIVVLEINTTLEV